jgi:hypothetical protein
MSELKQLADKLRKSVAEITGQVEAIDAQIEECQSRRSAINNGRVSKDDYLFYVRESLRRKGDVCAQRARKHVKEDKAKEFVSLERVMKNNVNGLFIPVLSWDYTTPGITDEALCFYFGDIIVDKLSVALEGLDWPADAIPASERVAMISHIDGEIEELIKKRDVVFSKLQEAGLQ